MEHTTLAERIERRLQLTGQTARAASLSAGLSDAFIRNILSGRSASPRGENLARLARQLRTTEVWLLREEGPEEAEPAANRPQRTGPRSEVIPAPGISVPDPAAMPRDLPVVGTAHGAIVIGKGGVFEGFAIDPERIVDRVGRPPVLAGTPDAYAVYIAGDSMAPLHPAGELRVVHPHRPVRPGDLALIQVRAGEGLPLTAYVKYFVARTERYVIARQVNPEATHRFAAETVVAVHRVLTYGELILG